MFHAKITRALLAVLMLGSVPAMAAIPPQVTLRLGGAELVDAGRYSVLIGSEVSLAAYAQKGDLIWVFAAPFLKDGSVDYTRCTSLLLDMNSAQGMVSGNFTVPKELLGQSFLIRALAVSVDGQGSQSEDLRIDVVEQNDSTKSADKSDVAADVVK